MKTTFLILIVAVLFLCSCTADIQLKDYTYEISNDKANPVLGTNTANDKAYELVVNTKSLVYHLNSCRYAAKIKPENVEFTYDEDYLLEHGFRPCTVCIKK